MSPADRSGARPRSGGKGAEAPNVFVRRLRAEDRFEVVRIDALHTGREQPEYWRELFANFVPSAADPDRLVALAAEIDGRMVGYLLGRVTAVEFGSDECGWVFAVGVDPRCLRTGVASRLLGEAIRRFRAARVVRVRTMVRREDVPVLSFFRASGFEGGSFVQLELDIQEDS